MRRNAIAIVTALVASVALVGPAANAGQAVTSGGASTQAIIQSVCTAAYTADSVTYTSNGSGTGRANFLNGTYDFGGADVGYSATDTKPANFTYVPVIGVPVAIAFNVSGVTSLNLTAKVLGGILNGRYTTWNDPEIAKLNPSATLPSSKITVVYRSVSSGTTQNLARFLSGNGASGWKDNGTWSTASSQSSPVGLGAATGATVVSTVASTAGSIGYADLADVAGKGLSVAAIRNPLGAFVKPTVAASAKFIAAQRILADGTLDIDYKMNVTGGYNLSFVSYAIAPTASGSTKGASVRNYITYMLTKCAPAKALALNYVPISGALLTKAKALVAKIN